MDEKNLIDTFLSARGDLYNYWNFYVVSVLALLGWLATSREAPSRPAKVIVTMFFVAFVAMNLLGLLGTLDVLSAVKSEISHKYKGLSSLDGKHVLKAVNGMWFSWWWTLIFHLAVDAAILFALWSGRVWKFNKK